MTDHDLAYALLSDMVRVRRMEEKCAELYGETKIRGFLHLYVGEEAVAAGSLRAFTADDAVVATYREHAHALLRGMPMTSIMAEMFGKQEGCSRGRGGSMHLFDAGRRFYGGNAIVAGGLPLAVGLGLADAMQHRSRLTACYFGDGAVAEGAFHESLNMAALWQLPVLFCCENNLYAMGTALNRAQSQTDLTAKAAAYKVPTLAADGMDVIACHDAAQQGADHIRTTGGPFFIEFRTYRFRAHSMFDPELYREKTEVEQWRKRDPIRMFSEQCLQDGTLTSADIGSIESAADQEVSEAVAFGDAGTWENVDDLERDRAHTDVKGCPMKTTYRTAIHDAMRDALRDDPRVVLMGEDVGRYGGTYAASKGLLEEFGPERVRDTPLSELGFVGVGIGAALGGLRPIVEVMTVNFSLLALDQIVNTAAALRHMSGGQFSVPLVVRMATGAGRQLAAQHSHSLECWYAHIPGIKVVAPATVEDAYGMLGTALADPDPVVIFEHVQLYNTSTDADALTLTDISHAAIRRGGSDVTVITYGGSLAEGARRRR